MSASSSADGAELPGAYPGDAALISVAAGFAELLHRAGLPMSADRIERFVCAVQATEPETVTELYWPARITLVGDQADYERFDSVFDQLFRGLVDPADSRRDSAAASSSTAVRRGPQPSPSTGPSVSSNAAPPPGPLGPGTAAGDDDESAPEREAVLAAASREERLATTDFAELTAVELHDLYELMRRIRVVLPTRPGRRRRRHRRGDRLDLRATIRRSRRSGGEPFEHVTRRARRRPRKLVVLCDISGSMAPYSRAFVQLLHAAAGASRAEVFTFATRLTRVTNALAIPRADRALARVAATVPDWRGGTRVGESLKDFVDTYGRRGMARGAVVVVVSDGWDRSDPRMLAEQMERLDRLAHRIVWVNPRSAAPGFAPLTGGMAAALPYCDALVSGNTLASLHRAMTALEDPR